MLDKKIFKAFLFMGLCKICDPWGGAFFDPRSTIRTTLVDSTSHSYIPYIKYLGFLASDKNIFKLLPYMRLLTRTLLDVLENFICWESARCSGETLVRLTQMTDTRFISMEKRTDMSTGLAFCAQGHGKCCLMMPTSLQQTDLDRLEDTSF